MGVRLPAEYQEVEYLQTDGNQRIRTNAYINSNNIDVECKIAMMNGLKTMTRPILLAHGGGGNYFIPLGLLENSDHYQYFSSADGEREEWANIYNVSYNEPLTIRTVFDSVAHKRAAFVNGLKTEESSYNSDLVSGIGEKCNLWLFTWMTSPNVANTRSRVICKFYHLRYREDDVEKLDLIPCYRKSDNKPGMYDLVTKQFFTNVGTGEFLVGGNVIDSISPWLVAWRRIMMAAASRIIKRIATGVSGVVNFVTKVKKPMKVTCEFSPVQDGTGDPSPDNVRPISGWTGCEITHTGKNLLDSSSLVSGKYIDNNGREQTNSNFGYTRPYSAILPNTTYILSGSWTHQHDYYCAVYFYDTNKEWIKRNTFDSGSTKYTFTTPANAGYIRVQYYKSLANAQVETGSTVTSFEPFQGYTVIPIAFTDPTTGDPMTVYGGTVTLNEDGSVDLVSDRAIITMNGTGPSSKGLSFTGKGSRKAADEFYTRIYGKTSSNGELFFGNVCSHAPEAPTGEADELGIIYFRTYAPAKQTYHEPRLVFPHSMGINTTEKANAWLIAQAENGTPVKYTYYIANPIRYHFHNVGQLQSFLGENNIWHDMNGQITVEYYNYQ